MLPVSKPSVIDSLRHAGNMSFIPEAQVSMALSQVSLTLGDGTQTEEYAHSNMAFVHAQTGLESFKMILKKLTL